MKTLKVKTSSHDRVLYPEGGITKGDVLKYYEKIASVMIPHVKHRPLMLQRFPGGIEGQGFFQKNVSEYFPKWISRVTVEKAGGKVTHALGNDADTLVYLANQGTITFHMWLSRTPKLKHPDLMVLDLDPSDDDFRFVKKVAFAMRDLLERLGLECFPMTTGSRGLHVSVPLDGKSDFDAVRDFAARIAEQIVEKFPERVTMESRKNARRGRLFLDIMRNAYAQTAVAPYSLRPKAGAPVATPLEWNEVSDSRLHSQLYNIKNIFRRLEKRGDPWQDIWKHPQSVRRAA
jgi:bifunctional non-homologous end joining protein LigD